MNILYMSYKIAIPSYNRVNQLLEKTLPLFIGGSFAFYRKIDGAITTEVSCNIFSPFEHHIQLFYNQAV